MPTRKLRKHLQKRLVSDLRAAGELGLAFLMTAGIASCGGKTLTGDAGTPGDSATKDDHYVGTEGVVVMEGVIDGPATFDGSFTEGARMGSEGARSLDAEGAPFDGGFDADGVTIDGPAGGFDSGSIEGPSGTGSGH